MPHYLQCTAGVKTRRSGAGDDVPKLPLRGARLSLRQTAASLLVYRALSVSTHMIILQNLPGRCRASLILVNDGGQSTRTAVGLRSSLAERHQPVFPLLSFVELPELLRARVHRKAEQLMRDHQAMLSS